jgi:hypothetical protein
MAATSTSGAVGTVDRVIRFAIGVAFLLGTFICPWAVEQGVWMQVIFFVVGVAGVGTAVARFCPVYRALGICTG